MPGPPIIIDGAMGTIRITFPKGEIVDAPKVDPSDENEEGRSQITVTPNDRFHSIRFTGLTGVTGLTGLDPLMLLKEGENWRIVIE